MSIEMQFVATFSPHSGSSTSGERKKVQENVRKLEIIVARQMRRKQDGN
jgi:hypothetical protein